MTCNHAGRQDVCHTGKSCPSLSRPSHAAPTRVDRWAIPLQAENTDKLSGLRLRGSRWRQRFLVRRKKEADRRRKTGKAWRCFQTRHRERRRHHPQGDRLVPGLPAVPWCVSSNIPEQVSTFANHGEGSGNPLPLGPWTSFPNIYNTR